MLTFEQLKENAEKPVMEVEDLKKIKNSHCIEALYYEALRVLPQWIEENQQLLKQYENENDTENANIAKRSLIVNLRNLANILEAGL